MTIFWILDFCVFICGTRTMDRLYVFCSGWIWEMRNKNAGSVSPDPTKNEVSRDDTVKHEVLHFLSSRATHVGMSLF